MNAVVADDEPEARRAPDVEAGPRSLVIPSISGEPAGRGSPTPGRGALSRLSVCRQAYPWCPPARDRLVKTSMCVALVVDVAVQPDDHFNDVREEPGGHIESGA